jgi:hypothetical protein
MAGQRDRQPRRFTKNIQHGQNRPFIRRSDTQRSFTARESFILPIFHLAVMIGKGRLPQ